MALRQIIVLKHPFNNCKKFTFGHRHEIKVTLGLQICSATRNISDTSSPVDAPTPAAVFAASNGPLKEPKPLGAHGPKLLPRPVRLKPSGGGNGGGPNNGGERTLASLIAYSGLVGTTALVLAYLSGIDVWSGFNWTSTDDLRLAVLASLSLQVLNAALLLPSFTSQRLPEMGNLQVMEAKLRQEQQRRVESSSGRTQPQPPSQPSQRPATGGDSAGSPTSTSGSGDSSSAGGPSQAVGQDTQPSSSPATLSPSVGLLGQSSSSAAATPAEGSSITSGSQVKASTAAARPPAAPAAGLSGGAGTREAGMGEAGGAAPAGPSGRQHAPPPGALPAAAWGSGSAREGEGGGQGTWEVDWGGVRSSLHLAQGYYISSNPTARLSPALEAAVAAVDTAAGEMLYRGVALTWLARWLEDRMYELGLDEVISYQLPSTAAELGGPRAADAVEALGVYGIAECAAVAGIVLFVVWSVLSASRRATQRLEALIGVVTSAGSRQGHSSGDVKDKSGERKGGTRADSSPRRVAQVLLQPTRPTAPVSGVEVASAVMRRAAAIQAARDAAQVLLLNGVFIATGGNLAASYSAALLNQLVISAMQRRGMRRMRERSAALARELQAYNAEMRRIVRKYKDKLPPEAASRLNDMKDETSENAGSSAPVPMSHKGADGGTASTSTSLSSSPPTSSTSATTSNGQGSPAAPGQTPMTMAASTSGTSTERPPSVLQDTSNTALTANMDSSSSSGGKLQRALSVLDQLVPEPPRPPKAPSPYAAGREQQHQQRHEIPE